MRNTITTAAGLLALGALLAAAPGAAAPNPTGPSSSDSPYLLRTSPGVVTTSVLTVGDAADNGYRLVGKPDGLGAFDNGDGTFTLLVNHEVHFDQGVVRAHGFRGAFVSRWTIDAETLRVLSGSDLDRQVLAPAGARWVPITSPMSGLCSADLPPAGSFHDAETGAGTTARLFLDGEESGLGRAFAHVVDGPDAGTAYRLNSLGRANWENQVTMPSTGIATVVVGTDDDASGQVYVYVGRKRTTGNDVERAGLVGGRLYGVRIEGVPDESDGTSVPEGGAAFTLVPIPGAAGMTEGELETASNALGLTKLARPEDSAWDTVTPGSLYVATTAGFAEISRLWNLRFTDPADVTAGGTADIELAGPAYDPLAPAGPRNLDNLTVNARGQVLLQEDAGNHSYLSGIYQYDPRTGGLLRIATHDPARFQDEESKAFLTTAEESSGIIPAPFLGAGKYLLTSQAHYATGDEETLEGGQLLVMQVPPGRPVG
jgi:hypothetical protein